MPMILIKLYSFQLLRALAYLHHQGIAHRDIKPQNVLVDPDIHKVALCDFGSAKYLNKPKEKSVSYISTRLYRAPELLLNNEYYSVEIDLWAAGCVIAEMLRGGKPIFRGDSNADLLVHIISIMGTP